MTRTDSQLPTSLSESLCMEFDLYMNMHANLVYQVTWVGTLQFLVLGLPRDTTLRG